MQKGFKQVNLEGCVSGTLAVPVIGENGNWFVGNEDTGVCAKGADGATGEQGPQGEKGDQGEIGPAGPQGIQGIQGEKGEQGIQGDKGDIGPEGLQGIQGIQGEKGDKGEQGEKGAQGEQGPKGTDADATELERLSSEIDTLEGNFGTFKKNFQDGCSTIASAITAQGVTTASNASPTTMATNIATIATNKYNAGYKAGTVSGYNVAYVGRVSGAYNDHAITSYGGTVYTDLNVAEIYLKIVSSYAHASHDNDSFDAGMSPVATKNGTAITVTGCGVNSNNKLFCWCTVDVYVKYKL